MNKAKISEFSTHYEKLNEWELFYIHQKKDSLIIEASIALDKIIVKRGIDITKLKELEVEELTQQVACKNEKQLKTEKRDALYFKWCLIVGGPIIILAALFRPGHFYETLVSSLVQGVIIGLIYWGYLKLKRSQNKKRP